MAAGKAWLAWFRRRSWPHARSAQLRETLESHCVLDKSAKSLIGLFLLMVGLAGGSALILGWGAPGVRIGIGVLTGAFGRHGAFWLMDHSFAWAGRNERLRLESRSMGKEEWRWLNEEEQNQLSLIERVSWMSVKEAHFNEEARAEKEGAEISGALRSARLKEGRAQRI